MLKSIGFPPLFFLLGILVQEVKYERVLPTHDGADLRTSTEFNFVVKPSTDYFTRLGRGAKKDNPFFMLTPPSLCVSFNADYQMVIDAQVVLTVQQADNDEEVQELLYPPRHQITLPLNNLNFIFENCEVVFNQTTKLTSDK